ncbi:hypothetical protein ABT346_04615 [Micromonospora peucetia]|uniref:hypothetical protein n=1 Tax=Micromonospora peucetia TaxID=47871 RepID=UPI00331C2AF9
MGNSYGGRHVASDTWVPVDRRWIGLDRRSLPPAIAVAVIGIVLAVVLPLVNQAVPDNDEIRPGDRLDLGGVVVTPPVGWLLEQGVRVGADSTVPVTPGSADAVVAAAGVSVVFHQAPFTGTTAALLDQINSNESRSTGRPEFAVTGGRATVTAGSGLTGLAENHTSASGEGVIAVFTFPSLGTGMTVEVDAAPGQLAARQAEITAMLRSVTVQEAS